VALIFKNIHCTLGSQRGLSVTGTLFFSDDLQQATVLELFLTDPPDVLDSHGAPWHSSQQSTNHDTLYFMGT
jgi:hypothetical protein